MKIITKLFGLILLVAGRFFGGWFVAKSPAALAQPTATVVKLDQLPAFLAQGDE